MTNPRPHRTLLWASTLVVAAGCYGAPSTPDNSPQSLESVFVAHAEVSRRLTHAAPLVSDPDGPIPQGSALSRLPLAATGPILYRPDATSAIEGALRLVGVAESTAVVRPTRSEYRDGYADTDVALLAGESWLEVFYTLRSAASPTAFELAYDSGGDARPTNDGVLITALGTEQPLLLFRHGVAVDANGQSMVVHATAVGGQHVRFVLEGTPSAYPVYVDPVVEVLSWTAARTTLPSMAWHQGAYDNVQGKSYVVGGVGGATLETWVYNSSWSQVGQASAPPVRYGFGLAYDTARQELVLFGGATGRDSSTGRLAETWVFDGTTWTKKTPTNSPSARRNMSMVYDATRQRIVLFGGDVGTVTPNGHTWEWDGTNWTQRSPTTSPSGRYDYALAYDANNANVVLFGGNTGSATFAGSTYTWDGTNWTLRSPTTSPPARASSTMSYVSNGATKHVVLFGGRDSNNVTLSDTWIWSGNNWVAQSPSVVPAARYQATSWYEGPAARACLFGGIFAANAVQCWNGSNWTSVAGTPRARDEAAVAYDEARGKLVVFGGITEGTTLDELWEWDQTSGWVLRNITRPSARRGAQLVFDSTSNRLLLFGGHFNTTYYDETWSFNGTTWTQLTSVSKPVARKNHRMAFDSVNNKTVLFGGQNSAGTNLDDTWELSGSAWSPKFPSVKAPARYNHALGFDANRGRVVLYGGQTSSISPLDDTWEWDGFNWSLKSPAVKPTGGGRTSTGFAYNAYRKTMVLAFGRSSAAFALHQDVWEWNGSTWANLGAPSTGPRATHKTYLGYMPSRMSMLAFGGATDNDSVYDVPRNVDVWELSFSPTPPTFTAPADNSYWNGTTLSGTAAAAPNLTVTVTKSGTNYCTAVPVNPTTGAWSCTPASWTQGYQTLFAYVTKNGLWTSSYASVGFTYDSVPPAAPSLTSPSVIQNTATPVFGGTRALSTSVEIREGANVLCTAPYSNSSTSFSCTSTPLGEGTHLVNAYAIDRAGNVSVASTQRTVVIDLTPPNKPVITSPTDNQSVGITTPFISGTRDAFTTLVVKEGSLALCSHGSTSTTSWSCQTSSLGQGAHILVAESTDAAGNTRASDPITVIIDTIPPTNPVILEPESFSYTSDSTPQFVVQAELGTTTEVKKGTTVLCTTIDGVCSPTTPLGEGSHTITALSRDAAGNASVSEPMVVIVDTIAPNAPVITSPLNGAMTNDTTPTISGSKEPSTGITVEAAGVPRCSVPRDASTSWSCTSSLLSPGSYSFEAVATDAAGLTARSTAVALTIDTVAPAAPVLTSPAANGYVNTPTPTFVGTKDANTSLVVKKGTTTLCSVALSSSTSWSCVSSSLAEGTHSISVNATDEAGNGSLTGGHSIIVDTVAPPTPTVSSPAQASTTNDTTPTFSGGKSPNTSVQVKEGAIVLCSAASDASSVWSCTPSTGMASGSHTVVAVAADLAGNTATSTDRSFVIDLLAPSIPTIDVPVEAAYTNDSTPPFSGTKEANTSLEVKQGPTVLCSVAISAATTWSCAPIAALADGPYTVIAVATDGASNQATSSSRSFSVDTASPMVPTISSPVASALLNDNTPEFSGTKDADTGVEIKEGGTVLCSVPANAETSFTCTVAVPLADGPHGAVAVAIDRAGNSTTSTLRSFTIDTATPTAPTITSPSSAVAINDSTPTFVGTREANSSIEVRKGAAVLCSAPAAASSSWTCTPTVALGDAVHQVFAEATDGAGNKATSASIDVVIDTSPPAAASIAQPTTNQALAATTPTFSGSKEAGAAVAIKEGASELCVIAANASTSFSCVASSALSQGTHTVTALSTDAAGNTSSSGAVTFVVDTVAPTAPVVTSPIDGSYSNATSLAFTGSKESNSSVVVKEGALTLCTVAADSSTTFTCEGGALAEGVHTIVATSTDLAGNSTTSTAISLTIDRTPPATPVVAAPADGATLGDSTPTFSGTKDGDTAIAIVVGAAVVCSVPRDAATSFTCTPSAALSEGAQSVVVQASDRAGNIASLTVLVTIDTVAPSAPVILAPTGGALTNDATPEISGTKEAGTAVVVRQGAAVLCSVALDGSTAWSCAPTTPLVDGDYSVTATASDGAGNDATSLVRAFRIDTVLPESPIVTSPASGQSVGDTTPLFVGTKEANTAIEIREGTVVLCSSALDESTSFACAPSAAMNQGSHTVSALAIDAAGNQSASSSVGFVVDSLPPSAPGFTSPAEGASVAEPTPMVTGTKEGGTGIEVRAGTVVLCTVPADATTSFGCELALLPQGPNTIIAIATDQAGNSTSSPPRSFVVDSTPPSAPDIASPASAALVTTSTPTVQGSKEPDTSLVLREGPTVLCSLPSTPSTTWSCTLGQPLGEGSHTIVATSQDAAGNAADSAARTFVVDTVAPGTPTISTPSSGQVLNTTTPLFSGTKEADTSISVKIGAVVVCTVGLDGNTTWSCTSTVLNQGQHSATAETFDAAGNHTTSVPRAFEIDTGVPTAPTIVQPVEGAFSASKTPIVSGSKDGDTSIVVREGSTILCSVALNASTSWSCTTSTLSDGAHTIVVTATDGASNSIDSVARAFVVDSIAPTAPIIVHPAAGAITSDDTPTLSGTKEAGSKVVVKEGASVLCTTILDSATSWSCDSVGLAQGAHVLVAEASDAAGNTTASASRSFTIDGDAPAPPTVVTPAQDSVLGSGVVAFVGTKEAGSRVLVFEGAVELCASPLDNATAYSCTATLGEGGHTVLVLGEDISGNRSTGVSLTIAVDTTAPGAPTVTQPAANARLSTSTIVWKGSKESGAAIEVREGNLVVCSVGGNAADAWTCSLSGVVDGAHSYTVVAIDAAGNSSAPAVVLLSVDTVAPTAPTIASPQPDAVIEGPVTVMGTAEAGATVNVFFDGAEEASCTTVATGGSYTCFVAAALVAGAHAVRVTATDAAGNTSALSDAITFTSAAAADLGGDTDLGDAGSPDDGPAGDDLGEPDLSEGAADLGATADLTTVGPDDLAGPGDLGDGRDDLAGTPDLESSGLDLGPTEPKKAGCGSCSTADDTGAGHGLLGLLVLVLLARSARRSGRPTGPAVPR